ncbi:MAG: hypothetical protein F4Z29_09240 [Gemmatimonadetes bacterium]|nr:hypothetical protein [Gemmatimonadota bacterium]
MNNIRNSLVTVVMILAGGCVSEADDITGSVAEDIGRERRAEDVIDKVITTTHLFNVPGMREVVLKTVRYPAVGGGKPGLDPAEAVQYLTIGGSQPGLNPAGGVAYGGSEASCYYENGSGIFALGRFNRCVSDLEDAAAETGRDYQIVSGMRENGDFYAHVLML